MAKHLFLMLCPITALLLAGCGQKVGTTPLKPDERLKKLESRFNQARKAINGGETPDFEELDKLATNYAASLKGSPKEADANKLVEKLREAAKKAGAKASKEDIKKGFGEIDQIFINLKGGG